MDTCLIVEAQKKTNSTVFLQIFILINFYIKCADMSFEYIYCDDRVAFYVFLRFVCVFHHYYFLINFYVFLCLQRKWKSLHYVSGGFYGRSLERISVIRKHYIKFTTYILLLLFFYSSVIAPLQIHSLTVPLCIPLSPLQQDAPLQKVSPLCEASCISRFRSNFSH